MQDRLRPIYPPPIPNLSGDALVIADSLLDEPTRARLKQERARLAHITAHRSLAFAQALGLSADASVEVVKTMAERASQLLPGYHEYINELLGCAALALTGESGDILPDTDEPPNLPPVEAAQTTAEDKSPATADKKDIQ